MSLGALLERVARRERVFRHDDGSPSRTQRHTCLVLSAGNKLEYQNGETKRFTRERRYLTCLLLLHITSSTLVEGSLRVADPPGLRLRVGGCGSTLDEPRGRVPLGAGPLLGQRGPSPCGAAARRGCPCRSWAVARGVGEQTRCRSRTYPPSPSMYSSDLVLANGRTIDPTLLQTWVTTSARPDFGLPVAESLQSPPPTSERPSDAQFFRWVIRLLLLDKTHIGECPVVSVPRFGRG